MKTLVLAPGGTTHWFRLLVLVRVGGLQVLNLDPQLLRQGRILALHAEPGYLVLL
jgi:hypothetical protein